MFGLGELAIILIVVILVLGAKRLPDLARSAGKSARILKSEARAMKADSEPAPGAQYSVRPGGPIRDDEPIRDAAPSAPRDTAPTAPRDAGPTTPRDAAPTTPRDAEGRPSTPPQ
ncbi:twin-arginine translocase TatA/TatE family subunit [Streptomyces sp. NPDC006645]|uniref:twin-arginine translocase TatA/TatE family subunit n=1 Tax=unclassified Streptomyces TaxID=2593676 RepID=UPI0033AC70FF